VLEEQSYHWLNHCKSGLDRAGRGVVLKSIEFGSKAAQEETGDNPS